MNYKAFGIWKKFYCKLPVETMTDPKEKLLEAVRKGDLEAVKEMLKSFCLSPKERKKMKLGHLNIQDKYNLFMEAVTKEQLEIVEHLISSGLNFASNQHVKSPKTTPPLHIAIENDDVEMFKLLLTNGADVKSMNQDKRTPLCLAAKLDKIEFVKIILEPYKGKVTVDCWLVKNHEGENGTTALHEAIRNDNKDIIKILLEEYYSGSYECGLNEAIIREKMDIIDNYIDYGLALSTTNPLSWAGRVFREAIGLNQFNVVEYLLNTREIDMNKRDNMGRLPLEIAIRNSHEAMVDYLLERGAECTDQSILYSAIGNNDIKFLNKFIQMNRFDLNLRETRYPWNLPLSFAVAGNHVEAVKILLNYGANPNFRTYFDQKYPLQCAVESKSTEIAKILLDHGASPNGGLSYGYSTRTPLHIAIMNEHIEMVQLLLDYGATITLTYSNNVISPLDCAAQLGSQEIAELLLDKGVFDGDSRQRLVSSAIYHATLYGKLEMVKFFLKEGAALRTTEDIVIKKSALHISAENGCLEIFKLLLTETLAQGGHVDDCDDELMTALHCVVKNGFQGLPIKLIIEERKVPSYITQDRKNRKEMIEILLAHGADIDARDIKGMTPLHLSLISNYYRDDFNAAAAVFLIKQGANFNVETEEGSNLIQCIRIEEQEDDEYFRMPTYDEKIQQAKELIREIVLRVTVENADLSQSLLQTIRAKEELKIFYEKCVKEAQKMNKEKFDKSKVTLADIIRTKNLNRLVAYTRNQSIVDYLESGYYRLKFIIYGQTIQDHFTPAFLRRDLLDHQNVKNFFNFLLDNNGTRLPNLPATFTNEVFAYLSNKDLESVKETARFVEV